MAKEKEYYLSNISKPNFFIIGASKCATTSIWDILRQHPNIFMSEEKEPSFFVHKEYHKRFLYYLSLFEKASSEKYIGEASPVYSETTVFPNIAERIYKFSPDAKIIYNVRNPIDRLLSVWKQALYSGHWYKNVYKERYGKENIGLMPFDFEKALFNYPPYLEASKYWTHLTAYLDCFPDDNIHLIFFEDFVNNPQKSIQEICDFLEIEFSFDSVNFNRPRNKGKRKKRMPLWFGKLNDRQQQIIKSNVPSFIIERYLKRPINTKNLFTDELRKKVIKELNGEIKSILKYANKPIDYWSLN